MAFRLLLSVLLCSGVALAASNSAESFSVAVVDIEKALAGSVPGQKAQKEYQSEVKSKQNEINTKKEEYEKLKESFQKQQQSLSDKAKRDKLEEIERLEKDLTRIYRDSQEELRRKNGEIVTELVKNIRQVVMEYGKEKNYTMILDKGSEALLFADKAVDVTDEVVARFNRRSN